MIIQLMIILLRHTGTVSSSGIDVCMAATRLLLPHQFVVAPVAAAPLLPYARCTGRLLSSECPISVGNAVAADSSLQDQVLHVLLRRCLPFAASALEEWALSGAIARGKAIAAPSIMSSLCCAAQECLQPAAQRLMRNGLDGSTMLQLLARVIQALPIVSPPVDRAPHAMPVNAQLALHLDAIAVFTWLCHATGMAAQTSPASESARLEPSVKACNCLDGSFCIG